MNTDSSPRRETARPERGNVVSPSMLVRVASAAVRPRLTCIQHIGFTMNSKCRFPRAAPTDRVVRNCPPTRSCGDPVMLKVHELAERGGVTPHVVRYYVRIGLLAPERRLKNGYQEFGEGDIRRLRFIKRCQHLGFTLSDIAEIFQRKMLGRLGGWTSRVERLRRDELGKGDPRQERPSAGARLDTWSPAHALGI